MSLAEGRLLDGFLLLAAGGSQHPNDIIKVNLSTLNIVDIASEDLAYFNYLNELDLSDNQLNYEKVLEELSALPKCTNILLSCNKISTLIINPGDAMNLVSLDLSYNELHGDIFMQLCHLNRLRYLNLSCNCISSIPPEEHRNGFNSLEELLLDGNDLVQFVQWRQLDSIVSLKKLSLASNRVKRLLDDCTEDSGGYFPNLEEFDISHNEIYEFNSLQLLLSFKSLRLVRIDGNPLASQKIRPEYLGCIKVLVTEPEEIKYLKNTKFARTVPPGLVIAKHRRVKYDKTLHSVYVDPRLRNALKRKGNLDDLEAFDPELEREVDFFLSNGHFLNSRAQAMEFSDENLIENFKMRRDKTEHVFHQVEGKAPDTYLRKIPFALSEETRNRHSLLKGKTSKDEGRDPKKESGEGQYVRKGSKPKSRQSGSFKTKTTGHHPTGGGTEKEKAEEGIGKGGDGGGQAGQPSDDDDGTGATDTFLTQQTTKIVLSDEEEEEEKILPYPIKDSVRGAFATLQEARAGGPPSR